MSIIYLKYPKNIPKTISFTIIVHDKEDNVMGKSTKNITIDDNLMLTIPDSYEEFKNAFNIVGLSAMNEVLEQVESKIKSNTT